MTNIRDLATLSGVSKSTVSRVLNNHPYDSKETREAVLGQSPSATTGRVLMRFN